MGQGARPGQATFFRGWVSTAISFPASLGLKKTSPNPEQVSGWSFHLGTDDWLLLGRQLQQDFRVTCVTPVTASDCPLRTSNGAGLPSGMQCSVDAQGLCPANLKTAVAQRAYAQSLVSLAWARAFPPQGS